MTNVPKANNISFVKSLLALLLMIVPPPAMYLAAQQEATGWIWTLVGLVVAGNLLVILNK